VGGSDPCFALEVVGFDGDRVGSVAAVLDVVPGRFVEGVACDGDAFAVVDRDVLSLGVSGVAFPFGFWLFEVDVVHVVAFDQDFFDWSGAAVDHDPEVGR
jgi:hypothetical protein